LTSVELLLVYVGLIAERFNTSKVIEAIEPQNF